MDKLEIRANGSIDLCLHTPEKPLQLNDNLYGTMIKKVNSVFYGNVQFLYKKTVCIWLSLAEVRKIFKKA